jgi:hypothetical protein
MKSKKQKVKAKFQCRICGEKVTQAEMRDHLEGHSGQVAGFDFEQVRNQFVLI